MGRTARWLILVALAVVLAAPSATGAQSTPPTVPPPTLSSTDLHVGDLVDVSGTGCIRPDTGSGEGLTIAVYRERQGRGVERTNEVEFQVAADGTYSGQWRIDQMLRNGEQLVFVSCQSGSIEGGGVYTQLGSAAVAVTATSPQLHDLVVSPGESAPFAYPCPNDGYGVYIDIDDGPELNPEPFIAVGGQTTHVAIPGDLPLGTHHALVYCESEGGTYAYFNLRLIVTPPGSQTPPPAIPQRGSSDYTG